MHRSLAKRMAGGQRGSLAVIGAGMAGLLAAAAASLAGWSVTLLEADPLTRGSQPRGGIPQGYQPHVLLYRGLCDIETLLPGLREQLVEAGGVPLDTGNFAFLGEQGWAPAGNRAFELVSITRPLLEHLVRTRVAALPGVELRSGERVCGVRQSERGGWLIETASGTAVAAGIAVDASGRRSKLPGWLAQMGGGEVETTIVDARFGYARRLYSAPADCFGSVAAIVIMPTPDNPAGGVALPVEDRRWLVAAVGAGERMPPRDHSAFEAFLGSLRDPALADFTRTAEPLGDVVAYRRTGNLRRHFDRMKLWPANLLAIGDSMCALNPVYGHGISVAARQAVLLCEALKSGLRPGAERRIMRDFRAVADVPWSIATGEDLRYPTSKGRHTPIQARFDLWFRAVDRLAVHGNLRAQRALDRIHHLVASPSELFHPALIGSVLMARLLGLPPPVGRPLSVKT